MISCIFILVCTYISMITVALVSARHYQQYGHPTSNMFDIMDACIIKAQGGQPVIRGRRAPYLVNLVIVHITFAIIVLFLLI